MHLDIIRHVAKITTTIMPKLTTIEENNCCELLVYSGADICCTGKHSYVLAIIDGISVFCRGFSDNDCKKKGEVILLQLNHCIYLGDKKNDAIACPN